MDIILREGAVSPTDIILRSEEAYATYTKSYSSDLLLKGVGTKSFTSDVLLKALGLTKTYPSDILIKQLGITKTYSADLILGGANTKEYSADLLLKGIVTKTYPTDLLLKQPDITKTYSADVLLKKADITKTYTADIILGAVVPWKGLFGELKIIHPEAEASILSPLGILEVKHATGEMKIIQKKE